jgi:8-oxo-dGTP pyrophosphatase MutT (NUDIX family)
MQEERSAGAVLFSLKDKEPIYLILHYTAGHWDFPKGNIEEDEDELTTVRREVKEETSICDIKFVDGFRRIVEYMYRRAGRLVHKVVIYYLAYTDTLQVRLSYEHNDYRWGRFNEIMSILTYNNSKMVLEEADRFLKVRYI